MEAVEAAHTQIPTPIGPQLLQETPPGGWLGSDADEGRAKLRYATGRRKEPEIRR